MRIRTIKPSFWSNDQIAELHPLTRLLFIGLWSLADVRGRLEDRPRRIKASLLPYDNHDVDAALDDLDRGGFVLRYRTEVGDVLQVLNFEKHQRISGKEAETESDFPMFDPSRHTKRTGKKQGSNGEEPGSPEGKGREGNKEGKGMDTPGLPLGIETPTSVEAPKRSDRYAEARVLLRHLNEAAGRSYRETETNLGFIRARLEEPGVDLDGCRKMIDRQVAKWKTDPKMSEFLRPETLFNSTKFDAYYAAKDQPVIADQTTTNHGRPNPAGSTFRPVSAIEQRNASLGPDAADHVADALRRSREHDERLLQRTLEEPGFSPFGDREPEVPPKGP